MATRVTVRRSPPGSFARTVRRGRPTGRRTVITTWRWIDTVTRQLELCDAVAGETAMVLATDTDDAALRELFGLGLERLGCHVAELIVRSGSLLDGGDPVDNEAVALALTTADLVIDLNGRLITSSAARSEILEQARVLAVDISSCADLDHLVAHPGLLKRLTRAEEMLDGAVAMTISSAAGTQLRMSATEMACRAAGGSVTHPGDLEAWPAGAMWVQPKRSSIVGSVVAMPGDIIHEAHHLIRSPIRLEISNGRINEVHGDSADADILRAHLESLDGEDSHDIAEIGWGMNLSRGATQLGAFEAARLLPGRGPLAAGQINIRTGDRSNPTAGVTLSLSNASLTVDDTPFVTAGRLEGAMAPDIYERAAGS